MGEGFSKDSQIQQYLRNLQFRYMTELVMFDDNGDPPGHYDVMNFQVMDNASMEYVSIGSWHNGTLALNRFIQIMQIIQKITFK